MYYDCYDGRLLRTTHDTAEQVCQPCSIACAILTFICNIFIVHFDIYYLPRYTLPAFPRHAAVMPA